MKTACIIGLGLIGGSVAKALKNKAGFKKIMAIDQDEFSLQRALDDNVIDVYSTDINEIDPTVDIVFICTPVSIAVDIIKKVSTLVTSKCIITDVGSTKYTILESLNNTSLHNFIGGHPMAGSESSGYNSSSEFLFENAFYIITPVKENDETLVANLKELIEQIGAIPVLMEPKKHDAVVAAISHLPHIVAASLVNTVLNADDKDRNMHSLAAGGFKDITRIASSDTTMWQSICIENKIEIINIINLFKQQLELFENSILNSEEKNICNLFESAKEYRSSFSSLGSSSYIKEYALYVDIIDKPGSIATIATLLSVNNVNIKNIGINNNREQQEGVLQVLLETEKELELSKLLLEKMNYLVFV